MAMGGVAANVTYTERRFLMLFEYAIVVCVELFTYLQTLDMMTAQ